MLFSFYEFILLFLPLTLISFALANRRTGVRGGIVVMLTASLVFYAAWDARFLAVLLSCCPRSRSTSPPAC